MQEQIELDGRKVGRNCPTYVIAELSGNHNGSIDRAKAIIASAAERGADAVKLQTYPPDTLTIDSRAPWFMVPDGGAARSRLAGRGPVAERTGS